MKEYFSTVNNFKDKEKMATNFFKVTYRGACIVEELCGLKAIS